MSVPDVTPAVKILTKQLEEAKIAAEDCGSRYYRERQEYQRLFREAESARISYEMTQAAQQKHEEAAVELEKALFALTGAEPQW